ncbi:MAG: flagellar basal body rod protein FlgB [Bacillota bacterium]
MWENLITNRSSKLMERSMDASNLRQQLLNQNLANVNTPHYKRLDIDFKSILDENVSKDELEMVRTHPKHFGNTVPEIGSPRITRETRTLSRYDTNNVDPEFEMAQVAENSLFFQALSSRWRGQMTSLKMVIDGR